MKKNKNFNPILIYTNVLTEKKEIYKNNKGKAGVYRWVNKINGSSYIGSSADLRQRFYNYFNRSHLKSNNSIISKALLKYGYEKFKLEILEYCEPTHSIRREKEKILEREQYYLDNFNKEYNIAKIAGSQLGIKRSDETKFKISVSIKNWHSLRTDKEIENSVIKVNRIKHRLLENQIWTLIAENINTSDKFKFISYNRAAKHFNTNSPRIQRYVKNKEIFKFNQESYKFNIVIETLN